MPEPATPPAIPERVFITGALGFIGKRLARRYQEAGSEVAGMDVRSDPALGVVAGDLTIPGSWQEAAAGAELVIHTAARVGMQNDPEGFWRVNVLGTRHALDAAARAGVQRFVHFSSIVAFGFDIPLQVDERHPVRPNGVPYVDTKVASEQVVLQAHAEGDVGCTIVRPGDVYGPGSHFWTVTPVREMAARRLVLPAMGRGQISPVYVDDLVEGVMLAGAHERAVGQVFTLSGGHDVEARDFVAAARRHCLECGTAGEHQPDHRAGQLLAERQRTDHRDEGDRVDAEVTVDEHGVRHLERQLGCEQRHCGAPHLVPGGFRPGEMQQPADRDRRGRHAREQLRAIVRQPA